MAELYSLVNPLDISFVARLLPEDPRLTLGGVLPDKMVPQIEYALDQVKQINTAAKFRAYDAPVELGRNPTFTRQVGDIPAVGIGYVVGEFRRLMEQQLSSPGLSIQPQLMQFVANYVLRGTRAIRAGVELKRGQLLSTGTVTIDGEGGMKGLVADFGVPAENKVTAPVLWSDRVNSNPIADIQNWVLLIQQASGVFPDSMFLGRLATQDLLSNAGIRAQVGSILGPSVRPSIPQVNTILAGLDLPQIAQTPDGRFVRPARVDVENADGTHTSTDTYPTNLVTLYESGNLGHTLWGPTFESLEFVTDGIMQATDAPGITAWVEKDGNPGQIATYINGVSIPVLEQPWGMLIATVR